MRTDEVNAGEFHAYLCQRLDIHLATVGLDLGRGDGHEMRRIDLAWESHRDRLLETAPRATCTQRIRCPLTWSDLAGLARTAQETPNKWLGFYGGAQHHPLEIGSDRLLDAHKLRWRSL